MSGAPEERLEFKAEIQKLLGIITHSLYTNREIFLRELVSNASDALDKLRFAMSKGEEVAAPDLDLEIRISVDKDAKTITVSDTGIGMSREELVDNIGTIARSGSERFLEALADTKEDPGNIIGRFGVGFYSVFMVADEVAIRTRSCRTGEAPQLWRSDGSGSFTVRDLGEDETFPARGTTIAITLKEDAARYLEKSTLEAVLKKHSSFISFPIFLEGERVNTIPALWREPKFSITDEQYKEFYTFLTFDSQDPLSHLHVSVDAPVQFTGLLFTPGHSFDPFGTQREEYGLDLYVRRVLIQRQNKDLIPEYLGFLKGVVDTEDLPLNISRETLQENLVIRKMSATITKQVLTHLNRLADEDKDAYEKLWQAHGKRLKLGYSDFANKDKIAPLMRFNSSTHEDAKGLASFDEYIARAKEGQKQIYFAFGASREAINLNPHMEIFRKKGIEVLYLYEPIDEFVMDTLGEYKEFAFTSVEHAQLEALDSFDDVAGEEAVEPLPDDEKPVLDKLVARIKDILGDRVTEVRVSERLTKSPCCLVNPDGRMTSSMDKIMRVLGKDNTPPQKVMEINPNHGLVRNLLRVFRADENDPHLALVAEQLYESSLLMEGYLSDPHAMVERINSLLDSSTAWYTEIKKV